MNPPRNIGAVGETNRTGGGTNTGHGATAGIGCETTGATGERAGKAVLGGVDVDQPSQVVGRPALQLAIARRTLGTWPNAASPVIHRVTVAACHSSPPRGTATTIDWGGKPASAGVT